MVALQTGSVLDRTVLKEGPHFLVADRAGDVKAANVEGHGLYFQDTRFLSLFELDLSGTRLILLSEMGELNFMSNLQFANDTLLGQDGEVIAGPRSLSVRRNRFLHDGLHERLGLFNFNPFPVRLTVRFTLGSDFRDMFDVRGYAHAETSQRGDLLAPEIVANGLVLGYRGRDGVERRTRITFAPSPTQVEIVNDRLRILGPAEMVGGISGRGDPRLQTPILPPMALATFEVELPPGQVRSLTLHVAPEIAHEPVALGPESHALDAAFVRIRDSYSDWDRAATQIETDHEIFDRLLRRARHDLRLLIDDMAGDLVPSAGIPWFAVPFGRDSLITAIQTLSLRPEIAAGTLRFLARHQGTRVDDYRDEQPGKILHEVRLGELARLGAVPHTPYYGSVDATPLFLVALGEYLDWTGDLDLARELLPAAERAVRWLDEYGDIDGDGFVEFQTRSPRGIRNQGWKDSLDSATHRDGTLAEPPIALAEVQGYVYAARRAMASLYETVAGDSERAREQRARAERLRHHFLQAFAITDEDGQPYWAMALDGAKCPVETVTTNPGHALWTGLLQGEPARQTVQRLLADDLLCGWGLRTLSSRARSFNPMSYHNGSVWPHDNALVALGMKRAGEDGAARDVATEVFEAGLRFPSYRLPELYCGFSRDRRYHSMPAQYPVSCSPQAWAAGSAFMLLQALLGLEADALNGVLRLRPTLPFWLSRVSLRKLRVGGRKVDLDIFREGHRIVVDVIEDRGLRIETREAREEWATRV